MKDSNTHLTDDEIQLLTDELMESQCQAMELEWAYKREVISSLWQAERRGELSGEQAGVRSYAVMANPEEGWPPFKLPVELVAKLESLNRRLYPEEYSA